MDAVTFIRDYARMCVSYDTCDDCPLYSCRCMEITDLKYIEMNDIYRIINVVDEWVKGHPVKTRLMDLLERYPKATRDNNGTPIACAGNLGYTNECHACDCIECWNSPLED